MLRLNIFGALVVVFACAAASQAIAKESRNPANESWRNARAEAVAGNAIDRAAALRQCNKHVAKLKDYTWGVQEIDDYRTCMAEHGQAE